jgi:hypothetical protein
MSIVWKNLGDEITYKRGLILMQFNKFQNNIITSSSNLGLKLPYIIQEKVIPFIPNTQEILMVVDTIKKLLDKIDIYGISYSLYVNYLTKRELDILKAKGYFIYKDYKDSNGYHTFDLRTFVEVPNLLNMIHQLKR